MDGVEEKLAMRISRTKTGHNFRMQLAASTLIVLFASVVLSTSVHGADQAVRSGSADAMIEEINSQIRAAWTDNEVESSPLADDSEWMRRVYLDIVGHIPSLDDVEKFLAD